MTDARARLPHPRVLALVSCVVLAGLPSCAPQLKDAQAPVAMPGAFSHTGTETVPQKWWTALGDDQLDTLIERSLSGNLSLRGTWDRLDQSAATARRAGAALYPSLTGTAEASRTRTVPDGRPRVYQNTFSLGLAAAYEVDLWGRVRSTVNAAELEVRATREDLVTAAMSLAAEVAGTWYRIVDQRGQMRLLDEQIRTNEEYLELVTLRFRRGKVSAVDVLQQRQLVEATRAEKVQTESNLKVLEHQLAILLGRSPQTRIAGGALPALAPLPRTGLPSELIRKRPDTRSAYYRLQEADQQVAVAVADRFPQLSLSAAAGTTAVEVRDLFENWLASIAANLTAPLLDGGRREAEVDRTRAVASERLHAYGQTVLEALKEVEDALVQESQQRRYVASLEEQLDLSAKAVGQTRGQYVTGGVDYLRVLSALQSHQRLQRSHLQAERELIQFRIELYRALGGGWEMERPAAIPVGGQENVATR